MEGWFCFFTHALLCLFLGPEDEQPEPRNRRSGQCHNPSVIKLTWEKDPEKRYALYTYGADHRKARVAYSPDGLRWTFVPETAERALFSSADVINYFRDPYRERFVATVKCGSRRGRAATVAFSDDGLEWVRPLRGGRPRQRHHADLRHARLPLPGSLHRPGMDLPRPLVQGGPLHRREDGRGREGSDRDSMWDR